ncbi:MAG: MarR family transcriptional regulator [Acidobacteriota bacterium]
MTESGSSTVETVLDRFVEAVFRLILEHHQRQVIGMDLTLTQAQALRILRAAALPTSKLAVALGISAPAVTQLTDRLVRKHLIERRSAKDDRRRVNIELTEKGRLIIDGFRGRRNELFVDALSRLSEDDRIQVIQVLGKITAVLEAPEQTRPEPDGGNRRERAEKQTAVQPADASKVVGHAPVSRPAKRMKIEWD